MDATIHEMLTYLEDNATEYPGTADRAFYYEMLRGLISDQVLGDEERLFVAWAYRCSHELDYADRRYLMKKIDAALSNAPTPVGD